jgi:hypothetical protein
LAFLTPEAHHLRGHFPSMVLSGLGVTLTIALLAGRGAGDPAAVFDRLWWLIVAGGALTSLLVVPMRTRQDAVGGAPDAPRRSALSGTSPTSTA